MSIVDIENRILSSQATPVKPGGPAAGSPGGVKQTGPTFGQVLADQLAAEAAKAQIKFSGHAQQRIASRNINLTSEDLQKIGDAVTRAAAKGARESLVLT